MFLIILLVALTVWAIVSTVVVARRDGYGARAIDWTRVAEYGVHHRDSVDPLQGAESSMTYR
jgi:hypothetical protein